MKNKWLANKNDITKRDLHARKGESYQQNAEYIPKKESNEMALSVLIAKNTW